MDTKNDFYTGPKHITGQICELVANYALGIVIFYACHEQRPAQLVDHVRPAIYRGDQAPRQHAKEKRAEGAQGSGGAGDAGSAATRGGL